jgi:hypothetical protein
VDSNVSCGECMLSQLRFRTQASRSRFAETFYRVATRFAFRNSLCWNIFFRVPCGFKLSEVTGSKRETNIYRELRRQAVASAKLNI